MSSNGLGKREIFFCTDDYGTSFLETGCTNSRKLKIVNILKYVHYFGIFEKK